MHRNISENRWATQVIWKEHTNKTYEMVHYSHKYCPHQFNISHPQFMSQLQTQIKLDNCYINTVNIESSAPQSMLVFEILWYVYLFDWVVNSDYTLNVTQFQDVHPNNDVLSTSLMIRSGCELLSRRYIFFMWLADERLRKLPKVIDWLS